MNDLAQRFTKWYYQKGYRMRYRHETVELVFYCPWWVRPLVYFLFSPSTYYHLAGYEFGEGLAEGIDESFPILTTTETEEE